MKCSQCQFDSPLGMKFCGQCGARLGAACARCGTENPPGFKFCGECGGALAGPGAAPAPLPEPAAADPPVPARPASLQSYTPPHLAEQILRSRSAIEGERKQVTVLFCDLVSSTALADRLGPETMHVLLNRFFELALGEVHRYEGTINQFLGDGFMALFGAPITHEDHARRAVLTALGLKRRLGEHARELAEPHGIELAIRMGLNTGWVVVGGIGDHLRMDYTAVGDTTNLAARLQQKAEPHDILASESTARLVREEARLEPLPPFFVKGKEEAVQAFRVTGGEGSSERMVLANRTRSPFVGRQRELAALVELYDLAAAGSGQVIGLSGEPGSGKSRLLQELRRTIENGEALCWRGRCLSYGAGTPFLPIVDLLRNAWDLDADDPPEVQRARLGERLAELALDDPDTTSVLARFFGLDDHSPSPALGQLSPQALLQRTSAALRQVFLTASRRRLLLVEIEDLHWSDPTSEDFLLFLIEGIVAARVLVLLSYRTGYTPRFLDKSYATQIPMRRLSNEASRALLAPQLRGRALSPELAETIIAKAEGNPFFLEELSRSVTERPGRGQMAVPDTIHGVLLARIDRLPEEHKRLLQAASVLGRELSIAILHALWDQPASLRGLLDDLKRWEFLYDGTEPDQVFFRHALTQEAVYQTLLSVRRRQLHATAGAALEVVYTDRLHEAYGRLAHHFSRAGEPREAIRYLKLLAAQAAQGYAHAEAVRALEEAREQTGELPAEERDRARLQIVLLLAESLLPLARLKETLDLLNGHRGIADRIGDPTLTAPFHFWLAHTHSYLGNQDEAELHAGNAIALARRGGDPTTEGKAHYVLSRDGFWAGRFGTGVLHGRQAVELLAQDRDRWWKGQAYWVLGFHDFVLGRFEEAFAAMQKTHGIWEELQDPRLDAAWSLGYFYAALGDFERGIEECEKGVARAQDPLNTAAGLGFLGYALLEKGDWPRAIEALERSTERLQQAGMRQLLGWFSAYLAEALARSGDFARAAELARQGIDLTRESHFPYGEGIARRAEGRVAQLAGSPARADASWRQALAIFAALEAPYETERTRRLLDGTGPETAAGVTTAAPPPPGSAADRA